MTINQYTKLDYIIFTLLFLFSLSFLDLTNYYILCIFIISLLIIFKETIYINIEIFWAICFFVSFLILNYIINDLVIFTKISIWVMMYLSGILLINKKTKSEKQIPIFMLLIALGLIIKALLATFFTDELIGEGRSVFDFWSGNIIKATHIGAWTIPMIGMFIYGFLGTNKDKKIIKLITLLGVFAALVINFKVGARTAVIIFGIMFIYTVYQKSIKRFNINTFKYIFNMLILTLLVFIVYKNNFLGITELIHQSGLYQRVFNTDLTSVQDDPRFERQIYAVRNFTDGLFGGFKIRSEVGQVHNLWIDLYDMVGIIPFIFIMLFMFHNLKNVFTIIQSNTVGTSFKNAIFGWYISMFLLFFFEPILEYGSGVVFAAYLFISGCVNSFVIYNTKGTDKDSLLKD